MPQIIYTLKGLNKIMPNGKHVLKDVYLSFFDDAKIGILGMNGAGKSTLMRIMAGIDKEFVGEAFSKEGASVGYLPQEPELDPTKTVKENVMVAVQGTVDLLKKFEDISNKLGDPDLSPEMMDKLITQQGELQEKIEAADAWNLDNMLDVAMDALRCPPGDASIKNLSGGEKRRVALCKLLLSKPDILLLDEPTNHLDAESVAWLEKHLQDYKGCVIVVTHDRYFMENVTHWVLELEGGKAIPWEANYSSWLEQKQARLAEAEKSDSKRQKTLARELEWVRQSPKARQAKSKARITAYENLLAESNTQKTEELEIYIPAGPRLGDVVIESQNVSKAFGDKLLFENLEFRLPRGGIVGVIGPNGAGKTTLFRLITGQDKADAGTFKVGESVKLAYVDQSRETLDANKSVYEEVTGGADQIKLGTREVTGRNYVARFNFQGSDQQKKVGELSGGERNRVHLAKMLKAGANVILLDEPTNDLDINTLRALEEGLVNFGGCAVVISHDRWFLDRIATHILAFEGESKVVYFEGNYQDYEADRHRRLGSEADQPHRIHYKKLVRN